MNEFFILKETLYIDLSSGQIYTKRQKHSKLLVRKNSIIKKEFLINNIFKQYNFYVCKKKKLKKLYILEEYEKTFEKYLIKYNYM